MTLTVTIVATVTSAWHHQVHFLPLERLYYAVAVHHIIIFAGLHDRL